MPSTLYVITYVGVTRGLNIGQHNPSCQVEPMVTLVTINDTRSHCLDAKTNNYHCIRNSTKSNHQPLFPLKCWFCEKVHGSIIKQTL